MVLVASQAKRLVTFFTGLLECMGFAGVVFGWASLVFVLKQEKYFANLCTTDNSTSSNSTGETDCSAQDERFSLIFTIASFLNNFMTLPNGFIFDRFGTMVTRLISIFLYTVATLLIAFSTAASAWLLFPALSLLAIGGILFVMTNMQIGNLFGQHRSTIITLYNGAFDSSSAVFLLLKTYHIPGKLQTNVDYLSRYPNNEWPQRPFSVKEQCDRAGQRASPDPIEIPEQGVIDTVTATRSGSGYSGLGEGVTLKGDVRRSSSSENGAAKSSQSREGRELKQRGTGPDQDEGTTRDDRNDGEDVGEDGLVTHRPKETPGGEKANSPTAAVQEDRSLRQVPWNAERLRTWWRGFKT